MVVETPEAGGPVVVEGGFPFESIKAEPTFEQKFPELFKTEAVIVVFSTETCPPCRRLEWELKPYLDSYYILTYKVDKSARAKELYDHYVTRELEDSGVPHLLVLEQGKIKYAAKGFVPWRRIKPHAAKAKKPADPVEIWIGPLTIDIDEDDVSIRVLKERRRPILDKIKARQDEREERRFEAIREKLLEYWAAAKAWVVENWDTILRVGVMIFMLL